MEKTKSIWKFVKNHKGKIIKGAIIVVVVVAGGIAVKMLTGRGEWTLLDGINPMDIDGDGAIVELVEGATEVITDAVA